MLRKFKFPFFVERNRFLYHVSNWSPLVQSQLGGGGDEFLPRKIYCNCCTYRHTSLICMLLYIPISMYMRSRIKHRSCYQIKRQNGTEWKYVRNIVVNNNMAHKNTRPTQVLDRKRVRAWYTASVYTGRARHMGGGRCLNSVTFNRFLL